MSAESVLKDIQDLLDQHVREYRGNIGQSHYKRDFFDLFREAYEHGFTEDGSRPMLKGDAMRDSLEERWIQSLPEELQASAREQFELFRAMWDEWRYACDIWPVKRGK